MRETTKRQGCYAHNEDYHRTLWEVLNKWQQETGDKELSADLMVAKYKEKIITAWMLFQLGDTM